MQHNNKKKVFTFKDEFDYPSQPYLPFEQQELLNILYSPEEVSKRINKRANPAVEAPKDRQVGGDHYSSLKVQPFDVYKTLNIFEEACQGNILKYVMRYKNKNGIEDLKKAKHYLEELLEYLQEGDQDVK